MCTLIPNHGACIQWLPQVATQWNLIGVGLKLPDGALDDIYQTNLMPHESLEAVFSAWQKTRCSPYTWASILKVLASREVGHKELADEIPEQVTCSHASELSLINL